MVQVGPAEMVEPCGNVAKRGAPLEGGKERSRGGAQRVGGAEGGWEIGTEERRIGPREREGRGGKGTAKFALGDKCE